jgi:glycosyltransferase involved in cell wall biosynthesis
MLSTDPLVSVIIPCYEQAHFLGEAIESVFAQTYAHHEIIVVDDGSTDDSAMIAARYPAVRYIRQENQGTAAARNTGLREGKGSFFVFLDADDRLLPRAFETALACLRARPECGFVFGLCELIAHDGSPLPILQEPSYEEDNYLAMLQGCRIWHPAAVMCRRSVFDSVPGFDTSLMVCSDYDFYLRVARSRPIYCHNNVVSEYRQHGANKSLNKTRMLRHLVSILRAQRVLVKGDRPYEEASRIAMRLIKELYVKESMKQMWAYVRAGGDGKQAVPNMLVLLEYGPRVLPRLAGVKVYQFIVGACIELFCRVKRPREPF